MFYFNYGLIFISSALFCFAVIMLVMRYLQERLEFYHMPRYEELSRFIKPHQLLQKQIFVTLITACVMFILQLLFGVERMVIAVPVSSGFAILACYLTYFYYLWKLKKRKDKFESQVLELAMGITNSMRSGLALGQAIETVSRRMNGPMQEELTILLREYRLGMDLSEVFTRMSERVPCEDLHLLATTIALTTRSGGSMVEVLEEMVSTIRERTEFHERLKNMTAQGRFEAFVISCAPLAAFVILYVIDPVLMRPLITTGIGWLAVGGACVLISIGYYVLNKIITIEV